MRNMLKWIELPPVWLLGFLVLGRISARVFELQATPLLKVTGAVFAIVGFGLMVWAILEMRRAQTTVIPNLQPAALVTSGPFALTRNPIYLGDALVLAGALLWWGAWALLLLVAAFIWVITVRFIQAEEARLTAAFGREFQAWRLKTRRWV